MKYYVYVLIDPSDNTTPNKVFYVGKGTGRRPNGHFFEAERALEEKKSLDAEIVGISAESILEESSLNESHILETEKVKKIIDLRKKGLGADKIVRVVARYLTEPLAKTIESFLITGVYGRQNLTNIVLGEHSRRFRSFDALDVAVGYLDELQSPTSRNYGNYYVYVLRKPMTNEVFYVGKGVKGRLHDHCENASRSKSCDPTYKEEVILEQLKNGVQPVEIGRIIADLGPSEDDAFAIESFAMKFVFGLPFTANDRRGHSSGRFRARGDWELRNGMDLPYLVHGKGSKKARIDELDVLLGEGLDIKLLQLKDNFSSLSWGDPMIVDSGELAIEADFPDGIRTPTARIKVFIRRAGIQIEVRARGSESRVRRDWLEAHLRKLGAWPLNRNDSVFLPEPWKHSGRLAETVDQAIERLKCLLQILSTDSRNALSPSALGLLSGLPRQVTAILDGHEINVEAALELLNQETERELIFLCSHEGCRSEVRPRAKFKGYGGRANYFSHITLNPECPFSHAENWMNNGC